MSYQALYIQVLQVLPQAVCHCDEQGMICASNPAAQDLLGYSSQTLSEIRWLELIHISDQPIIEDCWQRLHARADVPPCSVRCLRGDLHQEADGAYVSVQITFTATYDATGALEHVLLWLVDQSSIINNTDDGVMSDSRDIPESETLRAELKQALADKEAILNSILDAVTVLDSNWTYVYANSRVLNRIPDIVGRNYFEVFPEHRNSVFAHNYQHAFDSQQPVFFEAKTLTLKPGEWASVRVYPIGDRVTIYANEITERKKLEHALIESEAKFRTFFEQNGTPHTMSTFTDTAGHDREFVVNAAFARLVEDTTFFDHLNPHSSASIHAAMERVTHPEDFAQQAQYLNEVFAGQRNHYHLEKRYLKRNGDVIWVSVNGAFVRNSEGTLAHGLASIHDITERKRNEQNLQAALQQLEVSEHKFRTFFEASTTPLYMYVATEDGTVGLFNQALHDFLRHTAWHDYDHEAMSLAQSAEVVKAITYPDDVILEQAYMADVLAGASNGYRIEKRYVNKDGSILWGDLNTVTVRDDAGNVRLNIAIVQDITHIKRTEQALKTSEAKFRAFFEKNATPCTMFIFHKDVYSDSDWERGFHFNDAFANFLKDTAFIQYADRLSSVEDTMQALSVIAHPEDNALDEHYVAEVMAGKRDNYHFEKRYFTRDGFIIWGDISSVFLRDEQGELSLGLSIIQDITERKRAQAALEQALADKEMLLKEVHHRTKNNMQLVSSMLALQSRSIADDLAKQALVDSSKRINLLANMHRALYQTSDGDMINVGEQLSGLVSSLVASFRADVTVDQTIAAVYLDVHQAIPLSLIANELLTNVFKHAFAEPRATDTLTVSLQQQEDTVTLEVHDNGVGLPETVNQDSLGMIIIQSLTGQLGAKFTLENHPEGGTLARVRFDKN